MWLPDPQKVELNIRQIETLPPNEEPSCYLLNLLPAVAINVSVPIKASQPFNPHAQIICMAKKKKRVLKPLDAAFEHRMRIRKFYFIHEDKFSQLSPFSLQQRLLLRNLNDNLNTLRFSPSLTKLETTFSCCSVLPDEKQHLWKSRELSLKTFCEAVFRSFYISFLFRASSAG